MAWQDRFRELGDELIAGAITTDEYRERSVAILAEADREADSEAEREAERRVHIPASAALESPSGEMTQIVGSRDALDETMRLGGSIGEKLETGENSDD